MRRSQGFGRQFLAFLACGSNEPRARFDRLADRLIRLHVEALEERQLLSAAASNPTIQLFNASPALFAQNQGQWPDPTVRYVYQGDGANVAMTDAGPVFQVFQQPPASASAAPSDPANPLNGLAAPAAAATQSEQFSVQFEGRDLVIPTGTEQAAAVDNYLVGSQSQWHTNVPTYQEVAYNGLYAGIDLVTWGQRDSLKYEFHVAPGADYQQIRIHYDGIEGLSIDAQGVLHVQTALGDLTDAAPVIYQQIGGRQVPVAGQFKLLDADTYTFVITGSYDPTCELVIDPDLAWSTYLGDSGGGSSTGYAIAVDAAGNTYVTGETGYDFPTTVGAFETQCNGDFDVFVARLNASGSGLVYSTYLGGSNSDWADGIAVDASGDAYVTGETNSSDFPTTGGALQPIYYQSQVNDYDAFVAKLNASGNGLVYSTYLGGIGDRYLGVMGDTQGCGIALDATGDAYVTGVTNAWYFPTTAGALEPTDTALGSHAFVAKLNADGSALVYSTYLGGSSDDDGGTGIAVDSSGNAYVTGYTSSSDFPTTPGALSTKYDDGDFEGENFVAKLNASGSALVYSTYLGGNDNNDANGIAVDSSGNAYVTGTTDGDFPTTAGAMDTTYNGGDDVFVAKLNASGDGLVYSTYLGGSGDDDGYGIAVDPAGNAYVTGCTTSSDFPTTPGAPDTTGDGSYYNAEIFVAKLNASGSGLVFSTYFGGSGDNVGRGIAVDAAGNAYVTGYTSSSDFPTTAGALDTTFNGSDEDAFVATFSIPGDQESPVVLGISPSSGPVRGGTTVTITGSGLTGATAVDFGSDAASSFVVNSDSQITATTPAGSEGTVDVTVTTAGVTSVASSAGEFLYVAPPVVSRISPSSGSFSGGRVVTITGSNLIGALAVDFGTYPASNFLVNSDSQITAISPEEDLGTVDVTVTTAGGTSVTSVDDEFTYVVPPPLVSRISPWSGPVSGDTTVTIIGSDLTGATAVDFGSDAASSFVVNGDSQITATSPDGSSGTVDVTVTTVGGTSVTSSADHFTYVTLPTVSRVLPRSGSVSGGTTVTITGSNLTGATAVDFDTYPATNFVVNSDSQITAVSPEDSQGGIVDVTVTTAGGTSVTSSADQFTYVVPTPPVVSHIGPSSGPMRGGATVKITGSHLTGVKAVDFGNVAAANFVVNSNSQITAISPEEDLGTVDVTVTTAGGTSLVTSADQFTYIYVPPPVVSRIWPSVGPDSGGTTVKITGSHLTGTTAVDFGGVPASNFVVNSDSQITATSPEEDLGTVDVTVTAAGGGSVTSSADQFTYVVPPLPVISRISPSFGPDNGGTTVIITGSHLSGATEVDFGYHFASNFVVNSDRQITAISPNGGDENYWDWSVYVTVTTAGGTSVISAAHQFTYVYDAPPTSAYSPSDIHAAYGIGSISIYSNNLSSIAGTGAGQTIAIVDAYDDPDLVSSTSPNFSTSDLANFDAQFGLPDPPSFLKLDQNGGTDYPPPDPEGRSSATHFSWESEECMDVEWAHAIAPQANIVLIETNSSSALNLCDGVRTAAALPGVSVVSMSWGGSEFSGEQKYDSEFFTTPEGHTGVTFIASSGDDGSPGGYPADSPNVVAVGGTTLPTNGPETAWSQSGGGQSRYEKEPSYQQTVQNSGKREIPDVALDANPATGVAVYDSYDFDKGNPWIQAGGTSLGAPCWAGLIAIADQLRVAEGGTPLDGPTQTLPYLYQLDATSDDAYNDITSGNNGKYKAGPGYDMVTGLGSPHAYMLVPELAAMGLPGATAVSTASGPAAGAATVTITGTNLGSATEIPLGTIPVAQFFKDTSTQIEFSPAFAAGTADIQGLAAGDTPAVTSQDDFADTGTGVASQRLRLGVESSRPGSRAHVRHEVGLSSPDSTDAALLSMLDEWQTAT